MGCQKQPIQSLTILVSIRADGAKIDEFLAEFANIDQIDGQERAF